MPVQDNRLKSSAMSEVSRGRQRREIIFRPLFVYKEQEQELQKERRRKQHQHQYQAEPFVQQHQQQQHQNQDSEAYYGRPYYDPYDYSYFGFWKVAVPG